MDSFFSTLQNMISNPSTIADPFWIAFQSFLAKYFNFVVPSGMEIPAHGFFYLVIISIIGCIYYLIKDLTQISRLNKIRESLLQGQWMPVSSFREVWILKRGKSGLKFEDGPGCYIFLIFDQPVQNGDFSNYNDVYVGQSIHVYERIRQHISGKGNGDIYADIKYGRYVYFSIHPCPRDELNNLEKDLIASFNATRSYNKTRGGS